MFSLLIFPFCVHLKSFQMPQRVVSAVLLVLSRIPAIPISKGRDDWDTDVPLVSLVCLLSWDCLIGVGGQCSS